MLDFLWAPGVSRSYMSRSCFAKLVPDVPAESIQPYCLCNEWSGVDATEVQGKGYRTCLIVHPCGHAERFLSKPPAQSHNESYCTRSTELWLLCTPCTSLAMKSFSSLIKITSSNSLFVIIYNLSLLWLNLPAILEVNKENVLKLPILGPGVRGSFCFQRLYLLWRQFIKACNSSVPFVWVWTLGVWSLRLSFKSPQ